jgi:hypothetical protein
MAAGLADHAWTMEELLSYPLYPCHCTFRELIDYHLGRSCMGI